MKPDSTGRSAAPALALVLATAASFLLIVSLLFTSLQLAINDRPWFEREYKKLSISAVIGIPEEDVVAALMRLVDYMEGREVDIRIAVRENGREVEMFNEREAAHMVDVRVLYMGWRTVRTAGAIAALVLAAAAFFLVKKGFFNILARGYLRAVAAFLVLAAAIGLFAAVDFTAFWNGFHHLFFTNDLWLLNPATDRMIRICPERLFSDIVLRFGSLFLLCAGLLLLAAAAVRLRRKARYPHER